MPAISHTRRTARLVTRRITRGVYSSRDGVNKLIASAFLRLTASARRICLSLPVSRGSRPTATHGPTSERSLKGSAKILPRLDISCPKRSPAAPKPGCRVAPAEGGLTMGFHMSAVLATPPRTAELDRLGDEIAELSAHLDAATARLLALIREFDARGGWNTGFRSCAEWLGWRVGLNRGAARERVRVALARGELSYSKVRAITRVATPETEARLLAVGRAGTAEHVERIVQGWRYVDRRAEARKAVRQHEGRGLRVYEDEDGMVVVRGRLTPEAGALLRRALEAGREVLYQRGRAPAPADGAEPLVKLPTVGQQRADALALVAESALHHALDAGVSGERYQVVVHVDAAVLADPEQPGQSSLEDGAHVPAGTSRRLAWGAPLK